MTRTAYVANNGDGTVSVLDTLRNTVVATVRVGIDPRGVAVDPANGAVYVACHGTGTVTVVDRAHRASVGPPVGRELSGVAVDPANRAVYVTDEHAGTISTMAV